MKLTCFIIVFFTFLFAACDKNEENEFIMNTPPIGETYESLSTSITFESADSIRFHFIIAQNEPEEKAKYIFNNGRLKIVNPYGKFITYDKVTKAYFFYFDGSFTSEDKLEATQYELIARHGRVVLGGTDVWRKVKQESTPR